MSFDYGAKVIRPTGSGYKHWPSVGNRVCLMDTDLLPYRVGFIVDPDEYMRVLEDYKDVTESGLFQMATHTMDSMINNWIEGSGCDSALFFMTEGRTFRHDVAFTKKYKGERNPEKPPFFYELRKYLKDKRPVRIGDYIEADDLIGIELTKHNQEFITNGIELGSDEHKDLCTAVAVSTDKDIRTIPGIHWRPDTKEFIQVSVLGKIIPIWKDKELVNFEYWPMKNGKPVFPSDDLNANDLDVYVKGPKAGELKTKRVKNGTKTVQRLYKLEGTGLSYFYAQLIIGDKVDNYDGIVGKGIVAAYEALKDCKTGKELYMATLDLYKQAYKGETHTARNYRGGSFKLTAFQRMLEQGRLAWIQRKEGQLWRADSYCPVGVKETL